MAAIPFPGGQLFQVHGSKFKLHPVCHLGQASVLCITHGVFFFGIRKDTLNGFLPSLVKLLVFWRVAGVVRQVLVILPDMSLYGLYAILGMCAKRSGGTICADFGITFVFPVAVSVYSGVVKNPVFRANDTVVKRIIDILPPLMAALHRLRALVGCG